MSDDAIFCVGCGYDLRNLPVAGPCPECGRAIAESLGGPRLAAADPRWLARLTLGQVLVDRGLHLALISFGVMPLLAIGFGVLRFYGAPIAATVGIIMWVLLVTLLIGTGLVWFGAMLVTAPDPSESGGEPPHSARRLARWGLAASIVCSLLAFLVTTLTVLPVTLMFVARIVLQLLAVVSVTVGISALLNCLAARGSRIPDHDLARRTRRIAGILRLALATFLIAMVIAFSPLQLVVGSLAIRTVDVIQSMFALAGTAVGCVVLFMLARLSTMMPQYRKAFRAARDEASQRHAGN